MKKNVTNKFGRQLGLIALLIGLLMGLGSVYQAGAQTPQPETGPTDLPDPTPTPVLDIATKLQPYQLSGLGPYQADKRVLSEADSSAEDKPDGLSVMQEMPFSALTQQTFLATADATVLQGYPTANVGGTSDMLAGYDEDLNPDGQIVRSLIKFNIASLPSNQVITKATLRVHLITSFDFPNRNRTVTTYRITANWSEGNVTWNNKPGFGSAYGSKSIGTSDFVWHEFDVTDLIKGWYDGTFTNNGIMLRGPEISGFDSSWRGFSTREGPFTPELVIDHRLPAPGNLTATPSSQTQIALNWQNVSNETGYKLEQSLNGGSSWTEIGTTVANVTSFTATNLACSTTYHYRVLAFNNDGNSPYSNVANAQTVACPPPSNLVATPISQTQINLTWVDNSQGETGFRIEQSLDGTTWIEILPTVGANVTTYSATNLACGTPYHYRVRAFKATFNTAYSNPAPATTLPCLPPSNLVATPVSQTQINLAWVDNSQGETGFKVEHSTDDVNWAEIATVGVNLTTYTHSNLACGTPHHYRVRAFNTGGNTTYSNTAPATTFGCLPEAPSNLTATAVSTSQIDLAWVDNSSDETGFKIEQSLDGTTWTEIGQVGANLTTHSALNLACGTPYHYRVRAYNANGDSANSNSAQATTVACGFTVYLPLVIK